MTTNQLFSTAWSNVYVWAFVNVEGEADGIWGEGGGHLIDETNCFREVIISLE